MYCFYFLFCECPAISAHAPEARVASSAAAAAAATALAMPASAAFFSASERGKSKRAPGAVFPDGWSKIISQVNQEGDRKKHYFLFHLI